LHIQKSCVIAAESSDKRQEDEEGCGREDMRACLAAEGISKPDRDTRRPGGDPLCRVYNRHGEATAVAVAQCLNDRCGAPPRDASSFSSCSARSCGREDKDACISELNLEAKRRGQGRRKGNPFCKSVREFGQTGALSLNECLVTRCGAPAKTADDAEQCGESSDLVICEISHYFLSQCHAQSVVGLWNDAIINLLES